MGRKAESEAPPETGESGRKSAPKPGPKSEKKRSARAPKDRYAALDLGTNNCRLLVAAPQGKKLRIVDAYSRIVRLGEGVAANGVLSKAAMDRAVDALKVCADKIANRGVTHSRCIATEACRSADNGPEFLERVRRDVGLEFEVIGAEEEARLAVAGCRDLLDDGYDAALIFDIGGGSTELSWMRKGADGRFDVAAWTSMPLGVVKLSERWNGRDLTEAGYEGAVSDVLAALQAFGDPAELSTIFNNGRAHYLGTSGTVTSIAGVHLNLARYRRDKVDGLWLAESEARAVTEKLRSMTIDERADEPCIGRERADLVVCGCAILDALTRRWPVAQIRVADRGLREGMLAELAANARRERKRRRRRRGKKSSGKS